MTIFNALYKKFLLWFDLFPVSAQQVKRAPTFKLLEPRDPRELLSTFKWKAVPDSTTGITLGIGRI